MLTDQQLTETALRLIDAKLHRLATFDRSDDVDELLCEHHCTTPDCLRRKDAAGEELRAVHQHIKDAVAVLRAALARQAAAHGITLPTTT